MYELKNYEEMKDWDAKYECADENYSLEK